MTQPREFYRILMKPVWIADEIAWTLYIQGQLNVYGKKDSPDFSMLLWLIQGIVELLKATYLNFPFLFWLIQGIFKFLKAFWYDII